MKKYLCFLDSGEIVREYVSATPPTDSNQYIVADVTTVTGGESHYVANGVLVEFPPRPSPFYTWDWSAKTWVPDVVKARESRKAEVESERERHSVLPLTFDGKLLDADLKAQKNLSDKLQEVRERLRLNIPMPMELLVWRDADNVTHTFNDLQSYHDWLSSFAIAIAERGTRLYTQAWQHKANIEQLTTVAELEAYDINIGW